MSGYNSMVKRKKSTKAKIRNKKTSKKQQALDFFIKDFSKEINEEQ